jgi:hypothetical protein
MALFSTKTAPVMVDGSRTNLLNALADCLPDDQPRT